MTNANKDLYMTDEQYVSALKNLRKLIADGRKLSSFDDDTIGSKDTQCTWGLCCDDKKIYPDADMHLWPDEFRSRGRIAPKYLALDGHQVCPLENVESRKGDRSGCFYFCRVFQSRRNKNITREFVLTRIDELLAKFQK